MYSLPVHLFVCNKAQILSNHFDSCISSVFTWYYFCLHEISHHCVEAQTRSRLFLFLSTVGCVNNALCLNIGRRISWHVSHPSKVRQKRWIHKQLHKCLNKSQARSGFRVHIGGKSITVKEYGVNDVVLLKVNCTHLSASWVACLPGK